MIRKSNLEKKASEKEILVFINFLKESVERLKYSTEGERKFFTAGNTLKTKTIPNLKDAVKNATDLTKNEKENILNDPEGIIGLALKAQKELDKYDNLTPMFNDVQKVENLLNKIKSSEYLKDFQKDPSNNPNNQDFYYKGGFNWRDFAYWVNDWEANFDLSSKKMKTDYSKFLEKANEWHGKLKAWIPRSNDQGFPSLYSAEIELLIYQTFDKFMGNSRVEGFTDLKGYYDQWQEKRMMTREEEKALARYEGIPLDGVDEWIDDNYEKPYTFTLEDTEKNWSKLLGALSTKFYDKSVYKSYPMCSIGMFINEPNLIEPALANTLAILKS